MEYSGTIRAEKATGVHTPVAAAVSTFLLLRLTRAGRA